MALETPEELIQSLMVNMAFMFAIAMFCAYMLYHAEREAKRLLTTKEAWGTKNHSPDDPAAVARIRLHLIIFYAVIIGICILMNLKSFTVILELKNRILGSGAGAAG